jgi:hypothetical protein
MQKKSLIYITIAFCLFAFSSCIKQIDKTFTGNPVVEFDIAVLNSATPPFNYHVATRVAQFGLPITTANSPALTRTSGTIKLRVNLVGPQRDADETISYRVLNDVTPNAPAQLAVAGTHYNTGTTFIIPAKSSFGEVEVQILNPGTSSTIPREVHLELLGNTNLKPSENYKRVGLRIAQN